jgi:aryl-alcohol dehydrogenase-like predicted oxidoreductase
MHITRVGFGAWAIGGADWAAGWGAQDDSQSIAAIRHAVDRGINWIDTAAVYGLGHSEELVRRALEPIPVSERPYVFTKCGLVWDENNRRAPPAQVGKPESIRSEVNDSLRRLGVERIDLYQMHWPPKDGSKMADYWGTLVELRKEGKVRAVGLSNHNVHQLNEAEAIGHVDTLQPPFSAINRAAAAEELPWCHGNDTGVIVYSPMQSGLLTGSFTAERARALGADDWRSRAGEFQGDKLQKNLALAESLRTIANARGTSVGAVAVAWTLAWPGVTGAIVGARNPAQVDGWLDAARLTLSGGEIDQIAAAIHSTGAGTGPSRPPM